MRIGPSAVLAVAALLIGCNEQPQQQAATNQPTIRVRADEQEQLHKLTAFNLAIGLKHAIYDAGYHCKTVTDAGFVGTYKNLDMWTAHCVDGKLSRDWAIFAGPDGSAQVRDCKDIPGTGLPDCTIKERPKGSFTSPK